MKILYIAPTIDNLMQRMHPTEFELINALIEHEDFIVHHSPHMTAPPALAASMPPPPSIDRFVKRVKADMVVHNAISGNSQICQVQNATFMVHDFFPKKDRISKLFDTGEADSFISIPFIPKKYLPNCHWIGHYIPDFFNDYGEEKTIDVLSYGQIHGRYSFRGRLLSLLEKQEDIEVVRGPSSRHGRALNVSGFPEDWTGENLARKINSSHLVISDTSTDDYMVKKYLEVPACKSTVLGNVNEECKKVFPNLEGILEVSKDMTDAEIIEKVYKFLEKPKPSKRAYEIAKRRDPKAYAERLYEICLDIKLGVKP